MNDHDHEHSLTREQYRQQQLRSTKNADDKSAKDSWIHRQRERFMDPFENHNRPGEQLIHRHHENQPEQTSSPVQQSDDQTAAQGSEFNPAAQQQTDKETLAAQKTARLRRRLNIAIVILVLLIIVVYLVLFLVD